MLRIGSWRFEFTLRQRCSQSFASRGTLHQSKPGGVPVEFTEDSKRFIAEIIDKDADQGWDRVWALYSLRHERVDRLRVWWRGHFPYEEFP